MLQNMWQQYRLKSRGEISEFDHSSNAIFQGVQFLKFLITELFFFSAWCCFLLWGSNILHTSTCTRKFHPFHWHMQNTIPCRSQELLPFLSVMYFILPPFPINYSSILSHPILPSISWSTSQSCCSQIHIQGVPRVKVTTSGECFLC